MYYMKRFIKYLIYINFPNKLCLLDRASFDDKEAIKEIVKILQEPFRPGLYEGENGILFNEAFRDLFKTND